MCQSDNMANYVICLAIKGLNEISFLMPRRGFETWIINTASTSDLFHIDYPSVGSWKTL